MGNQRSSVAKGDGHDSTELRAPTHPHCRCLPDHHLHSLLYLQKQEGGAQRKQHLRQLAVEKVSGASEVQQLLLQLSSGLLQQTVGQQLYASLIPETLQKSAKPLQVMGSMLAAAASLLSRAAAAVPGPSTRAALDRTNWRVRGALAVMQREHPQVC